MLNRTTAVLAIAVVFTCGAFGQKTTNFTYTITLTDDKRTAMRHASGAGSGTLGSIGPVAINLDLTQPINPDDSTPLDNYKGTISFVFNRLDSFDVPVTILNGNGNFGPLTGNITGGKGAYQGATGSVTFTFTSVNGPRSSALVFSPYQLSATGNVTVGGKTTALNLPATAMAPLGSSDIFQETTTGTFTASPLGSGTLTIIGAGGDNNTRQAGITTLKFNANDSISTFITFIGDAPPASFPGVIVGGTGAYAGATGAITANFSVAPDGNSFVITGSGAVTTGAAAIPVITEVTTAFGNNEIAPNTWTVIKGKNLVPANLPPSGVIWSNAPEFASGKMPTNLQGISVTVNGVPAYVYFYCSAATDPSCATDQINILTPLDAIGDAIPAAVVVTNGTVSSAPFIVNETSFIEPSFLLFSPKGHVVGVHTDGSLLGPTSLYPGLSTPAKVGETVLLFAVGFGLPKGGATQGSATQSGAVQATVNCSIAGKAAAVPANIISPGLTQLNVTIPAGTPSGDNLIFCGGAFPNQTNGRTPAGNLITVQ